MLHDDVLSLGSLGLVLVGTAGFILLHSSQCQPKNTSSIVIANLLSIAIATILFWATGYAFSFGNTEKNSSNFFLSHTRFFLIDATSKDYTFFAQEVCLITMVVVLVNAGFVSRMRHWLYPFVAIFTAGFIYPCARHWSEHNEGWLKDGIDVDGKNITYTDLYGAGSIHVFCGAAALIGTVLLSPRKDRKGKSFKPIGGSVTPLILIGGLLAIIGMMAKNGSFELSITNNGLALVNNILSAQASALVAYTLKSTNKFADKSSTKALINGAIAGLVGMSCMSDYHPYGGFVVGVVSGLSYVVWSALLQLCHVDDPTDSISVHLGTGLWALLAGPLFLKNQGCFYNGDKEAFQKFGWHLLGGVAIFVWSGLTYFLVLIVFVCTRIIRYKSPEATENGLDAYVHNEPAYPDRDHYTQEVEPGHLMDDLLTSKQNTGTSYHVNGSYEHGRAQKPTTTLDGRNDQRWREARY